MTLLYQAAQQRTAIRTMQFIALTLLLIVLSWSGTLPVLLACGEPPLEERGMTLKDVTQGSLLFKTPEARQYIPAPLDGPGPTRGLWPG